MPRSIPLFFVLLILGGVAPISATVLFWEELPYFSEQDSPFYEGIQAGTIHLEDFEDHELNTPNVVSWDWPNSEQVGHSTRTLGPGNPNTTWSVDGDDGLTGDFRGSNGNTWTTTSISFGGILGSMEFRFTPDILGRYPTFVGFVITEPLNWFDDVEFGILTLLEGGESSPDYDPLTWVPNDSLPGDTRRHRFFGVHVDGGIERLVVRNVRQIDHLQYGYAVPEPAPIGLLAGALMTWACLRRRTQLRGDA